MSLTIPNPASPPRGRHPKPRDRGQIARSRHWQRLLRIAFGEPMDDLVYCRCYTPRNAIRIFQIWQSTDSFQRWAQSLPPEDAAKLFAILHE